MNDRSYTKLFSTILGSSLWSENSDTRIAWITMLALANEHGEVFTTAKGLSHLANIPLESARSALEKFESPDPESRSPENEGRRIERTDSGYRLLNYQKYRDLMSKEDRAEYQRKYIAKYRADGRDKSRPLVNTGKQMLARLGQAEAEAEVDIANRVIEGPGSTLTAGDSFARLTDSLEKKNREDWNAKCTKEKMLSILGPTEIAKRRDWLVRLERSERRIERIMDAMHADILIGRVIKNRGAYAETLWKQTV